MRKSTVMEAQTSAKAAKLAECGVHAGRSKTPSAFFGEKRDQIMSLVNASYEGKAEEALDAWEESFPELETHRQEVKAESLKKEVRRFVEGIDLGEEILMGLEPKTFEADGTSYTGAPDWISLSKNLISGKKIVHAHRFVQGKPERGADADVHNLFLLWYAQEWVKEAGEEAYETDSSATSWYLRHPDDKSDGSFGAFSSKRQTRTTSAYGDTSVEERLVARLKGIEIDLEVGMCGGNCSNCKLKTYCKKQPITTTSAVATEVESEKPKPVRIIEPSTLQERILGNEAEILVVNAGPGSGKTSGLVVKKVVNHIFNGTPAEKILLLSFTKAAVKAMRKKIKEELGEYGLEDEAAKIRIETFNSFCGSLVDKNYERLGFTEAPGLMNATTKGRIIEELREAFPMIPGYDYANPEMSGKTHTGVNGKLASLFATIKEQRYYNLDAEEAATKGISSQMMEMYREYTSRLKELNLIEYADQMSFVADLMDEDINQLAGLDYEYIIVDEFQDTSELQVSFLQAMTYSAAFKGMLLVGDDDQNITASFRECSSKFIIEPEVYFPGAIETSMTENYRCSGNIIRVANRVIARNKDRVAKSIVATRAAGSIPSYHWVDNPIDRIVEDIKADLAAGTEPKDCAVLCKTHNLEADVLKALKVAGIPVREEKEPAATQNPWVLAWCGAASFASSVKAERENGVEHPYYDTLGLLYLAEAMGSKLPDDTKEAKAFMEELVKKELAIIETIGEEQWFLNETSALEGDAVYTAFTKRVEAEAAKAWDTWGIDEAAAFGRDFIRFEDTVSAKEEGDVAEENAVTVCTAHASKGLEWKSVYILLDGWANTSQGNAKEYEEARRLLYVAITRAMDNLRVYASKSKTNHFKEDIEVGMNGF